VVAAARDFLTELGVDLTRDGMADTPARMARAYAELFTARPFTATTFANDADYDELVIARRIPLVSVCEHHLLPFTGTATVGYLPSRRLLGLSKLARLVEHFARRPQVQERLTRQIAHWLTEELAPKGVGVLVHAEHTCMTLRGAQAVGSSTVTSTLLGLLRQDPAARAEFFTLARIGRRPPSLPVGMRRNRCHRAFSPSLSTPPSRWSMWWSSSRMARRQVSGSWLNTTSQASARPSRTEVGRATRTEECVVESARKHSSPSRGWPGGGSATRVRQSWNTAMSGPMRILTGQFSRVARYCPAVSMVVAR
jgi:GTP cyclohydrolase I